MINPLSKRFPSAVKPKTGGVLRHARASIICWCTWCVRFLYSPPKASFLSEDCWSQSR